MKKNAKRRILLLAIVASMGILLLSCTADDLPDSSGAPPIFLDPVQDCNGFKTKFPYPVDPNSQGILLQTFALNIQPILEGNIPIDPMQPLPSMNQKACIQCHKEHNFSTGVGFKPALSKFDPDDLNTQYNYNQFLCSAQLNFQHPAGSRVLEKLRGKNGYDSGGEGLPNIPGLHHMDNQFIAGDALVYEAFRKWVDLEAQLRTPKGIGTRSITQGGISQLCWLERPRHDFVPGGKNLAGAERPLLICQPVNEHNQLIEQPVDITTLVTPPLTGNYDLSHLVANKGEEDAYKLFVAIREGGGTFNVAQIDLKFAEGESEGMGFFTEPKPANKIIGAERKYIVDAAHQTGCKQYRINELGQMITRCSEALPTAYAYGKVFFESNQPIPEDERLTPEYPDPADPTQPNPAIPVQSVVTGADAYHGGSVTKNSFTVGDDGIPHIFFPNHLHFQENLTIGSQGKFAANLWENKVTSQRWLVKGPADIKYGVTADVEAPVMGLSTPLGQVAEDDLLSKLVFLNSGPLAMGVQAGGVEIGGAVQVAYHERGGFTFLSDGTLPADKAPPIQNPIENFEALGAPCDATDEDSEEAFILHGVYGMPSLDATGAALFVTGTEEVFDTCAADQVPQNLGIWWVTLNGDREPVLSPLPAKPYFSNGYYVGDLAWVGKSQESIEFIPEEPEDEKISTVYIPNVPLYLAMKNFTPANTQQVIDQFKNPGSSVHITKVAVLRNATNPPSHLDTSIVSEARGSGMHPSFAGSEFATNMQVICKTPVQQDGSIAINIPARMGYSLQFLTTIQTPAGAIDIPVRQDQIRVSKPGMQQFQAPVSTEDFNNNCMGCHGSLGAMQTVEEMILSHSGKTEFDRKDTQAMKTEPADCYTSPVGPYADYVHDIAQVIESKGCKDCHGLQPVQFTDVNGIDHHFDDISPAGGLNFERTWADTIDPLVSSRYTHAYGQGDDCPVNTAERMDPDGDEVCVPCGSTYAGEVIVCTPHGVNSPFEPGYVLLQTQTATVGGNHGSPVFLGNFGSMGSTVGEFPGAGGQCGTFLMTVFGDVRLSGDCQGTTGFDGQTWVHPNTRYPLMLHPLTGLPYDHHGQFTLEETQKFLDTVTTGFDYNRAIDEILAPPGSPYAGQPRWGLAPEP